MNKKGFTLVELLAVIGVLAIILVIAVPKMNDYILTRKKDTFITNARNIARQLEYDNMDFKMFDKVKLSELGLVELSNKNIDLNNSLAYVQDNEIYIDLVGIDQYKDLYVCGVSISNKNINVQDTPCDTTSDNIIYIDFDIDLDGGKTTQNFSEKYSSGNYLTLQIPTKKYYTFSHWEIVNGDSVIIGNRIKFGSTATSIKAVWKTDPYLTIDLDGGVTNQKFENQYSGGTNITLQVPTKEGYTFIGWDVESGNSVVSGNVLTMGNNDTKIKAKWEETGATYITNLLEKETEQKNGLVQTTATVNSETVDVGIRYVGPLTGDNAVKNQVYFNCKDKDTNNVNYGDDLYDYANSCEVWRIIGVFNVDNGSGKVEKRIKIIRDAFSVNMSWDSSASNVNSGSGINQWGESTYTDGSTYEGSDIMIMLNKYYVRESEICAYCNGQNQGTCSNDCSSSVTPLSITSVSMVDDALWNIGSIYSADDMSISTMYNGERSTTIGKKCNASTTYNGLYLCTDKVNRTINWIGKIGLIYPSEYAYASANSGCASDICGTDSTCNKNNWLHPSSGTYLTILSRPHVSIANRLWIISAEERVGDAGFGNRVDAVRPTLYLSSKVYITGGNGTEDSPYKLAI